jgi:hypothetical protein
MFNASGSFIAHAEVGCWLRLRAELSALNSAECNSEVEQTTQLKKAPARFNRL